MKPSTAIETYIAQPELFVPVWSQQWTPPATLLDFEEKVAAYNTPRGRLMSFGHRGDRRHYPENSLEGILSCIHMGVDMVEVDAQLTRDGVLILMLDEKLNRTTNWPQLRNEPHPGLPDSDYVRDWTYEQLCHLRLRDRSGRETDCRIPTAAQAIRLCAGRIMILFDHVNDARLILPLVEQYDREPRCTKTWHWNIGDLWVLSTFDPLNSALIQQRFETTPHILEHRVEGETLCDSYDAPAYWEQMYAMGYNLILSNHPLDLVRFVARIEGLQ